MLKAGRSATRTAGGLRLTADPFFDLLVASGARSGAIAVFGMALTSREDQDTHRVQDIRAVCGEFDQREAHSIAERPGWVFAW